MNDRQQNVCPAPVIRLSNGELDLTISVPGAAGTYCGERFSWAGILSEVTCRGHHFFGPWQPGELAPDLHDNVTGTAGEFGMGIAGMPSPLGFEDAAPGELFSKIGVGVLRRPDREPYQFSRCYEHVNTPLWQVQSTLQQADMCHSLMHDGYGYDYAYRISLVAGQTSFITRHSLTNSGRKPIHQTHYSHNFLVMDRQPVGPDYEVIFPFEPGSQFASGSVATIDGRTLGFREPLDHAVFSPLTGFGDTAADNQVTVHHRQAGLTLRITGDLPVTRYHFFAAPGAVCPEPFVDIRLEPGETATWQHRYDLIFD